ncbi:MAG: dipeptide ABC transporter ATP-binding protein [Chromatiales bacterium]|jgi:oligopeptide transport system ATP-binding protein|nr:dipeptide ABC transporter ATP-binding protein [Chromatiales bacterium]
MMSENLLEVRNLTKHFTLHGDFVSRMAGKSQTLKAVDGINFAIKSGETLGLVGESGCGKSTTGRLVTRLVEPSSGEVLIKGRNLLDFAPAEMKGLRKTVQLVFQDPYASLNPRKTIMQILERPLEIHELATDWGHKRERVLELLNLVGLGREHIDRYPHEFSGGQRQRIAIARALAVDPELIIGDEPVSALDVSVQAQILNLFRELQESFSLTYLFIAHDLSVVRHISDRVAVMYVGKIVETGPVQEIFARPQHPYTQALMAAVPEPDLAKPPPRLTLKGEVATPIDPPPGCRLNGRCPMATEQCGVEAPELREMAPSHMVACHNI